MRDKTIREAITFLRKTYRAQDKESSKNRRAQQKEWASDVLNFLANEKDYIVNAPVVLSKDLISDILLADNELLKRYVEKKQKEEKPVTSEDHSDFDPLEKRFIPLVWADIYNRYTAKSSTIRLRRGFILSVLDKYEEVIGDEHIREVREENCFEADGDKYYARGDYEKALECYEKIAPERCSRVFRVIRTLLAAGREQEAMNLFDKELKKYGGGLGAFDTHFGLAEIFLEREEHQKAFHHLHQAITNLKLVFMNGHLDDDVIRLTGSDGEDRGYMNKRLLFSHTLLPFIQKVEKVSVPEDMCEQKADTINTIKFILHVLKQWEVVR